MTTSSIGLSTAKSFFFFFPERRARYRERLIVVRDRMAVRDEARGVCTCEDGRLPGPYTSRQTRGIRLPLARYTVALCEGIRRGGGCLRLSRGVGDELVSLANRITIGLHALEFTEHRHKRCRLYTLYTFGIRMPVWQPAAGKTDRQTDRQTDRRARTW